MNTTTALLPCSLPFPCPPESQALWHPEILGTVVTAGELVNNTLRGRTVVEGSGRGRRSVSRSEGTPVSPPAGAWSLRGVIGPSVTDSEAFAAAWTGSPRALSPLLSALAALTNETVLGSIDRATGAEDDAAPASV